MSHEMMRLAAEMANQNNPKGAAFIREAERIGREAGVLSPSLGLVLLTPEQYTNLLEGNSSEPASPWVDGVLFHPLFTYNSEDRSVYSGEEKVSTLTRTEEDILRFLSERANRVVTPKRLTEDIWGYSNVEGSELVKGRIRSLRTKIPGDKIDSRDHEVIKTIGRDVGYMYRDPSMVKSNVVEIRVGEVESERIFVNEFFTLKIDSLVLETEDVNGVMVTQDLTTLERDILELLVINSGMFVTHNRFGQIKVNGDYFDPNNLKTHISHIRRKIKNGRGHIDPHKIIEAKQGVGYRLNVYPPRVE